MGNAGLRSLVGLTEEKRKAEIGIEVCRQTGETFGHTLLYGVGGTGKTELSRTIARELGYAFIELEAASLKNRNQVIELLTSVDERFVLFLDEVHRLSTLLQEAFYFPMKEGYITSGKEKKNIAPMCLIAATTRIDMLDEASFIRRFDNVWLINRYDQIFIEQIVASYFRKEGMDFGHKEISCVSQRCLGIPRQAIHLAKKVRNQVIYRGGTRRVTINDINTVCELEGIDNIGLSKIHVGYLRELYKANSAKGLSSLSAVLGQHPDMISGHIEQTLFYLDFIDMHPRGRIITSTGRKHLDNLI